MPRSRSEELKCSPSCAYSGVATQLGQQLNVLKEELGAVKKSCEEKDSEIARLQRDLSIVHNDLKVEKSVYRSLY